MQEYINLAAQARAASQAATGGNQGGGSAGPTTGPSGNGENSDGNNSTNDNTDKFKIIAYDGHQGTDVTVESNGGRGFSLNEAHSLYQSNQRT